MPKIDWNVFLKNYPTAICFGAGMRCMLPTKAPRLDRNGRKLPTPYAAACQILASMINGDWCIIQVKGGVLIKVADIADANKLVQAIGATTLPTRVTGCSQQYQLHYSDSNYAASLRVLGFAV